MTLRSSGDTHGKHVSEDKRSENVGRRRMKRVKPSGYGARKPARNLRRTRTRTKRKMTRTRMRCAYHACDALGFFAFFEPH